MRSRPGRCGQDPFRADNGGMDQFSAPPVTPGADRNGRAGPPGKVLSHRQLLDARRDARRRGLAVVHCHGCFDIVHPGHIRHLRQARTHGDILLVTITGDAAMKKGTGRPLIPEELRAENLAALDCVDWVYIEPDATAAALLDDVQPDVYVKGREYELNDDPRFRAERAAVERHGGRVVFSSGDVVFSSTALIRALERSADPYHGRLVQLLDKPELDGAKLSSLVSRFRGKKILIIGEALLDTYVLCDRPEVAAESPVMTLRPVERITYDGGAAIIARHAAAMGATPTLLTVLPDNEHAGAMRNRLLADGVEVHAVNTDHPLAEKQRFLVDNHKVMKLDLLEQIVLDATLQEELIAAAADRSRDTDAAIIADFGQGVFSPGVLSRLCATLRRRSRILTGDVSGKRAALRHMRRMDLLCPSETELRDAYRAFDESLPAAAWKLISETRARSAIVTMGHEGLVAFEPRSDAEGDPHGWRNRLRCEHVPALCGHAVDALGCGDALLAAATLALASDGSLIEAAFLGSVAAAAQAQRLGNTPVSATDLRHGVARLHASQLAYTHPEVIDSLGKPARRAVLGSEVA